MTYRAGTKARKKARNYPKKAPAGTEATTRQTARDQNAQGAGHGCVLFNRLLAFKPDSVIGGERFHVEPKTT
jgi:hypothetical protein